MVKTSSDIVRYLKTNGPSSGAELPREADTPTLDTYERKAGVRRFNPSVSSAQSKEGFGFKQTKVVFYLEKEHDPREVIREWVDLNPQVLEGMTPRSFLQAVNNAGSKFADVSKEVTRELFGEARWNDAFGNAGGNEKGTYSQSMRDRLLGADPSEVFEDDDGN